MRCRDLLHRQIQALRSDLERSHCLAITLNLFCKPAVAQDEQLRNFEKYQAGFTLGDFYSFGIVFLESL